MIMPGTNAYVDAQPGSGSDQEYASKPLPPSGYDATSQCNHSEYAEQNTFCCDWFGAISGSCAKQHGREEHRSSQCDCPCCPSHWLRQTMPAAV